MHAHTHTHTHIGMLLRLNLQEVKEEVIFSLLSVLLCLPMATVCSNYKWAVKLPVLFPDSQCKTLE